MRLHHFSNRDDVVKHLAEEHDWPDPIWNEMATWSQVKDATGHDFIPASEYLAIHRELEALS